MNIPDEGKCSEMLLDIGYYRLGFYWKFFERDDEHNFKEGTCFSNVVKLYYLDVDLRNLLLKYIYRIEVNFRTQIIYHTSNKFPTKPTWFIDPICMEKDFIDNFDKIYNAKFIKNNYPIRNHHQKYINDKFAPAWKTLEFFTFGTILKVYKGLKDIELKKQISSSYGIKKYYILENFIDAVVYVRNMCSHGGVLYDITTPKGIKNVPGFDNGCDRHSLQRAINVIYYLLSHISLNRKNELESGVNCIFDHLDQNKSLKEMVNVKMGVSLN